jgi:hypothetical protein
MTTDQIKTKLRRLVADWKIEAEAQESKARKAAEAEEFKRETLAYTKAAVYRDHIWDLEQIIKEEE